jgi:hypothetical protein
MSDETKNAPAKFRRSVFLCGLFVGYVRNARIMKLS